MGKRKEILLFGRYRGRLSLEYQEGEIFYELYGSKSIEGAEMLFSLSDGSKVFLKGTSGSTICDKEVLAAGIFVEGELVLRGGETRVLWDYIREEKPKEEAEQLSSESIPALPNPEPVEDTQPLSEEETLPLLEEQRLIVPEKNLNVQTCLDLREESVQPFPYIFPESVWEKVEYSYFAGTVYYLKGKIFEGGELLALALAVPAGKGFEPPAWLSEFDTYLEDLDKNGYWLIIRDIRSGGKKNLYSLLRAR